MTRDEIVEAARGWIGTPFIPQASVKGSGTDCAGLIKGLALELGSVPIDTSLPPYKQTPDNGLMRRLCDRHLRRIEKSEARAGDVVIIRFDREHEEHHLAVLAPYGSGLSMIHALKTAGSVREHRLDAKWRSRIVFAYQFPGVE